MLPTDLVPDLAEHVTGALALASMVVQLHSPADTDERRVGDHRWPFPVPSRRRHRSYGAETHRAPTSRLGFLTLGALAVIGYFLGPVFGLSEDGQTCVDSGRVGDLRVSDVWTCPDEDAS